jgi:hypothetical protein
MEGMLNYYKANYPREPYKEDREFPPVKCPVLMIHGLQDQYLLSGAYREAGVSGCCGEQFPARVRWWCQLRLRPGARRW